MIDAMHDSIKAVWLSKQIAHLAGIEKWISPTYHPLFEISQIRHLSAEQLAQKFDPSCSPYQRLPPLQFITMTPPRPSKADNQDLVPRVEDFNTGGRLHGLYVAPNMRLPQHIIRRFTAKTLSEKEEKHFHQQIIITRMQWVTETNAQLLIQKGLKPTNEKVTQPHWLDMAEATATTHNTKMMSLSVTEKISNLNIKLEDFLIEGRLSNYPIEGVGISFGQVKFDNSD